jgi:hypothetical protein
MSILLNEDQGRALENPDEIPPRVIDPISKKTYVLLATDQYERIKDLLEDDFDIRQAYPLMDAVAAKEGWNDPEMDIYNDLDPRKNP